MPPITFATLYLLQASHKFHLQSGEEPMQGCDSPGVTLDCVYHTISVRFLRDAAFTLYSTSAFSPTVVNRADHLEQNLTGLCLETKALLAGLGRG